MSHRESKASAIELCNLATREILPGFVGQFIHTDSMTLVYWTVTQGATLPEHQHPHEQVVNLLEGEFKLVVDGVVMHLTPGQIVTIPSEVAHSGEALSDCRILDVFTPTREDYR